MKKSQVSLLLIVLLAALIISYISFSSNKIDKKELASLDEESEIFKKYIQQCISQASEDAIFNVLSLQGGKINPDVSRSIRSGYINVQYWYHDSRNISPSLDEITSELEDYVVNKTNVCIAAEDFLEDIAISSRKDHIKVYINPENIIIEAIDAFELEGKGIRKIIDRITVKHDIPFGKDFMLMKNIFAGMKDNPSGYDFSAACAQRKGLIDILSHNDRVILNDFETYVNDDYRRTLVMQFAVKGLKAYGNC